MIIEYFAIPMLLNRTERLYPVVFVVLWLLAHLPFLHADPSILLDSSRGAFTDEGLYLFQVGNWFKGAGFEIFESDGFLKTPLYNALLAPFVVFNSLWVIRLISILLVGSVLSKWCSQQGGQLWLPWVLLMLLSMQSNLFGHSHLAMAECYVFGFLLLSLVYTFHADLKKRYLGILFLGIAIGCKIQYIYLAILLIPYLWIIEFGNLKRYKWLIAGLPFVLMMLLALVFSEEYAYILGFAKTGKMQGFGNWLFRIRVNLMHLWESPFNVVLSVSTLIVLIGLAFIRKKMSIKEKQLMVLLLGLFFLEAHKLLYIYLPQRYVYLLFGVMIIINVTGIIWLNKRFHHQFNRIAFLGMALILFTVLAYYQHWQQRSFEMKIAKEALRKMVPSETPLIGPWAPSLSLGLPNPSHTAWNDFFENRALWQGNKKHMIISESDFKDNQGLFQKSIQHGDYQKIGNLKIKNWVLGIYQP